jgi:Meckel syndrome type 1 protein
MMSNTHHDHDLPGRGMETLSALFDGELEGDAARFAMKRLGHDPQWRQAIGTWQLLGDALRGQAASVAPADFAARVVAAVAAESAGHAAAPDAAAPAVAKTAARSSRRKWLGGAALAASVAMVAMFVARPFSQDSSTNPGTLVPAPTQLTIAPTPIPAPADVTPASPGTALPIAAAAIAVAEVPRRMGERRSRGQSQRAGLRAPKRQSAAPAIVGGATALAVSGTLHSSANPFRPQHVEVVSRPWPRAALPGSPSAGSLTASFGTGTAGSPSFYPFEPRLPNNTSDGAPAPLGADERRR